MAKLVALDANLIILLVVGLTNPKYISIHKRLQQYDIAALNLLTNTIAQFDALIVTPNALSEASNLLRYVADPAKTIIAKTFHNFIQQTQEIFVESKEARQEFLRVGLTDAGLLEVAKADVAILSVDLELCIAAETAGYSAINLNHIRDAYYEQQ
jgi:hypothetical protein